jgi:xanthine/CO dehydrogenase XdhC/CoxF family maturation factor
LTALPKTYRDELLARHPLAHAREVARAVFQEGIREMARAAEQIDPKTACGLLAGGNVGMLAATRMEWHRARENLSK